MALHSTESELILGITCHHTSTTSLSTKTEQNLATTTVVQKNRNNTKTKKQQ